MPHQSRVKCRLHSHAIYAHFSSAIYFIRIQAVSWPVTAVSLFPVTWPASGHCSVCTTQHANRFFSADVCTPSRWTFNAKSHNLSSYLHYFYRAQHTLWVWAVWVIKTYHWNQHTLTHIRRNSNGEKSLFREFVIHFVVSLRGAWSKAAGIERQKKRKRRCSDICCWGISAWISR